MQSGPSRSVFIWGGGEQQKYLTQYKKCSGQYIFHPLKYFSIKLISHLPEIYYPQLLGCDPPPPPRA